MKDTDTLKHHNSFLDVGISIIVIFGIFLCGAGMTWFLSKNISQFAVVDMQALIAQQSRYLAADPRVKTHAEKVSAHQIQEAGQLLKEKIQYFAIKNRLILLNKNAVMGGNLPDYTAEIREDIFPDTVSILRKLMKEGSKYHEPISSIIPKLFSNKQERKQP